MSYKSITIQQKQTKFIVTFLQMQHAYFKPKGFSGKNTKHTVTILYIRENVTFSFHNIC